VSIKGRVTEEGIQQAAEIEDLRGALLRAQRDLLKAKGRSEHLTEVVIEAARDAVLAHPIQVPSPAKDARKGRSEAAVWHLTDWQGAKKTTSYNTDVMRERVHRFVDKAEKITNLQRASHPVKECHILLGGDMIEGLFNFPTQPFEIDATLFEQFVTVSNLLVEVTVRAAGIYEKVTVVAEWGNHGRLGSKRAAIPRSDNADRMTYELARQVVLGSKIKNVTWQDCPEDIQRVEIGNYRALLIHGDEIGRNGYASPTTIVNHVNRWRSGSYPWHFRDTYIGHYHTHYQMSLADGAGAVYGTGSTESDNRYASVGLASSGVPSQRLHFVDPEEGRVTAQYQVWLDK
jgi:hypothetical protein